MGVGDTDSCILWDLPDTWDQLPRGRGDIFEDGGVKRHQKNEQRVHDLCVVVTSVEHDESTASLASGGGTGVVQSRLQVGQAGCAGAGGIYCWPSCHVRRG